MSETVSPKVSTTNPGNDVPADGNGKDAPNAPAPAPLPPSNAPLRTRLDEILPGPKDLPADPLTGIYPLFLTSMTQDLFKIKTGEDVTAERPMKVIPKADILADMYTRAAISDWSPLKQLVNVSIFTTFLYCAHSS